MLRVFVATVCVALCPSLVSCEARALPHLEPHALPHSAKPISLPEQQPPPLQYGALTSATAASAAAAVAPAAAAFLESSLGVGTSRREPMTILIVGVSIAAAGFLFSLGTLAYKRYEWMKEEEIQEQINQMQKDFCTSAYQYIGRLSFQKDLIDGVLGILERKVHEKHSGALSGLEAAISQLEQQPPIELQAQWSSSGGAADLITGLSQLRGMYSKALATIISSLAEDVKEQCTSWGGERYLADQKIVLEHGYNKAIKRSIKAGVNVAATALMGYIDETNHLEGWLEVGGSQGSGILTGGIADKHLSAAHVGFDLLVDGVGHGSNLALKAAKKVPFVLLVVGSLKTLMQAVVLFKAVGKHQQTVTLLRSRQEDAQKDFEYAGCQMLRLSAETTLSMIGTFSELTGSTDADGTQLSELWGASDANSLAELSDKCEAAKMKHLTPLTGSTASESLCDFSDTEPAAGGVSSVLLQPLIESLRFTSTELFSRCDPYPLLQPASTYYTDKTVQEACYKAADEPQPNVCKIAWRNGYHSETKMKSQDFNWISKNIKQSPDDPSLLQQLVARKHSQCDAEVKLTDLFVKDMSDERSSWYHFGVRKESNAKHSEVEVSERDSFTRMGFTAPRWLGLKNRVELQKFVRKTDDDRKNNCAFYHGPGGNGNVIVLPFERSSAIGAPIEDIWAGQDSDKPSDVCNEQGWTRVPTNLNRGCVQPGTAWHHWSSLPEAHIWYKKRGRNIYMTAATTKMLQQLVCSEQHITKESELRRLFASEKQLQQHTRYKTYAELHTFLSKQLCQVSCLNGFSPIERKHLEDKFGHLEHLLATATITPVPFSVPAPTCVQVRGVNPRWSAATGIYRTLEGKECEGNPVYKQAGGIHYMFFKTSVLEDEPEEVSGWVVGLDSCSSGKIGLWAKNVASPNPLTLSGQVSEWNKESGKYVLNTAIEILDCESTLTSRRF